MNYPEETPPLPPRPARSRPWRRRGLALAVLAAAVAGAFWVVKIAVDGIRNALGSSPHVTVAAPVPPKPLRIVFPEGFTRREMAERITAVDAIARRKRGVSPSLSATRYLAATASSPLPARFAGDAKRRPLEGFLFPATYDFTGQTTSAQLVQLQLAAFRRSWATVDLGFARSKNLTQYDVLIIASMVEKEARAPEERRKIAAVIYNRLRARMPLGIDATIRYALGVPPTSALRRSQLASPSPYNTRLHLGLPPTPIANPGLAAIQAAAHPASVGYLYFVRKPDKVHHFFTTSYRDFLAYERAHGYGPSSP